MWEGGVGGVVGMQTRVYFLFLTCLLELLINENVLIRQILLCLASNKENKKKKQ